MGKKNDGNGGDLALAAAIAETLIIVGQKITIDKTKSEVEIRDAVIQVLTEELTKEKIALILERQAHEADNKVGIDWMNHSKAQDQEVERLKTQVDNLLTECRARGVRAQTAETERDVLKYKLAVAEEKIRPTTPTN